MASLKRLVDGSGLIHHSNTGYASNWVMRPGHIGRLAGREYVGAMHVRLSCRATPERRGRCEGEIASNRRRMYEPV